VNHEAKGANATWDRTATISPVIPTFRAVIGTIARAFPTTFNGTAHSTPTPWFDIQALVTRYIDDRLTYSWPDQDTLGNFEKVRAVKRSIDVWEEGVQSWRARNGFPEWSSKRAKTVSSQDLWEEQERGNEDAMMAEEEGTATNEGFDSLLLQLPEAHEEGSDEGTREEVFAFNVVDELVDEVMLGSDPDFITKMALLAV
jgi:hypothetical protein